MTRHWHVVALGSALLWIGACCPPAQTVRAYAKVHKGGLVLSGRLLSPATHGEGSSVQVEVTNCDRTARTIYWPSQKGSVTWIVTESPDGTGRGAGGACPKGLGDGQTAVERPSVVLRPGHHWSIVCDWFGVTPDPQLRRFTVNATVETAEGLVKLTSTRALDAEVVPVCDWSEPTEAASSPK